jgi:hypothetical protein
LRPNAIWFKSIKSYRVIVFLGALLLILSYTRVYVFAPEARAENRGASDIKIISDRWPDASTINSFVADAIRLTGASTDEEKALAIWRFARMFSSRTDGHIPTEPVLGDTYIDDPLKVLNVYGAHWCDGLARIMEIAWRSLGLKAEKLYRSGHTQIDVYWKDSDGVSRWHMFDVSEGWYVYDRTGTHIATPDEIAADSSLIFRPSRGPIPKGPHYCGFWNWIHAPHLSWPQYSNNIDLKLGTKLTRYFSNLSIPYQDNYASKDTKDFEHGPYPVTYGNSTLEISPDLTEKSYEQTLFSAPVNVKSVGEDGLSPNIHPSSAQTLSSVIFKIKTPYIISDAQVGGTFFRKTPEDKLNISVSNDGQNWKYVWQASQTGRMNLGGQSIAGKFNIYSSVPANFISPFGRYDYYLKIEMQAVRSVSDVGVNSITIRTTLQHNIFSLPQLWPGRNRIDVNSAIAQDTSLKITYEWQDLMGASRKNVAIVEQTPYRYEILTSGNRWNDVIVKSIIIETVPRIGRGNYIDTKEQAPASISNISQLQTFATDKIVGTIYPRALKTAFQYIADLETESGQVEALSGLMVLRDKSAFNSVKDIAFNSIASPNKDLAVQALYEIDPVKSVPVLLSILRKNPAVKWKTDLSNKFAELEHWYSISGLIGHILSQANEKSAVQPLMSVLDNIILNNDTAWEYHGSIIRSLGRLGDIHAAPSVRPFLMHGEDVSAAAMWALGNIGDKTSTGRIKSAFERAIINGGYPMKIIYGAEALGKLGDQTSLSILFTMLFNSDEDQRGYAAESLGRLGNKDAVPRLQLLLETETFPWVREAAQNSINILSVDIVAPNAPVNLRLN